MQPPSHRTVDPRSNGLNNRSANQNDYDSAGITYIPFNPYHCVFELQSGDVTVADHEAKNAVVSKENVTFHDENQGTVHSPVSMMPRINDATNNTELGNFLKRPVRIWSVKWRESDAIGGLDPFYPWKLFFDTAAIKYKLNNYAFIRCNLKIKVVVNASPFYYGALLLPYHPLQDFSPHPVYNTVSTDGLPAYTQRPHVWIYPQNSEGAEMTLPFIYPKNWLRIQKNTDFQSMGRFDPLIAVILQSASGVTGVGVDVQVYAWAENVEISGTSTGLALQGGDEYDENGIVSGPASAVATAASRLKDTPGIGKFATAAEIGASSIAKIASMFGFSNTPNIAPTAPFRPTAFPPMASAEASFPSEPLALDPKNGVSIDPKHVGSQPADPLSVANFVARESVLTAFEWNTDHHPDDVLFSSPVTPGVLFSTRTAGAAARTYATPVCWLAQMFKHWRGDLIFRFRVIASQFHKGRIRVVFDPAGYAGSNVYGTADATPVVQTLIIDIGKDTDVSVRIPYNQALGWLQTSQDLTATNKRWKVGTSPTFTYDDDVDNGSMAVKVTTALTANTASSAVFVLVSVKGADNFEYANPSTTTQYISPFELQSKDEVEDGGDMEECLGDIESVKPDRFLLNFGENIVSLRSLLQRTYLHSRYSVPFTDATTRDFQQFYCLFPAMPQYFGYDKLGIDTAKGITVPGSNFKFTYSYVLPIHLLAQCFLGWRGSMVWTINPSSSVPITQLRMYRQTNKHSIGYGTFSRQKISPSADTWDIMRSAYSGSCGQMVTNQYTQTGMSVTLPYYNNYLFYTTCPTNMNHNSDPPPAGAPTYIPDGSRENRIKFEAWINRSSGNLEKPNVILWNYTTIGPDFSPVFFLNVPEVLVYPALPEGV